MTSTRPVRLGAAPRSRTLSSSSSSAGSSRAGEAASSEVGATVRTRPLGSAARDEAAPPIAGPLAGLERSVGSPDTAPEAASRMISITGPVSSCTGTPGAGVTGRGGPSGTPLDGVAVRPSRAAASAGRAPAAMVEGAPVARLAGPATSARPSGTLLAGACEPVRGASGWPAAAHAAEQYATTLPSSTPTYRERNGSTGRWHAGHGVMVVPGLRRRRARRSGDRGSRSRDRVARGSRGARRWSAMDRALRRQARAPSRPPRA